MCNKRATHKAVQKAEIMGGEIKSRTGFELPTLSFVVIQLGYKKCSTTYYDHGMASTYKVRAERENGTI